MNMEMLYYHLQYEITARSGDDTIRRIIMIPTSGFPDDRESAAVNSVVKDRASFVEYIAFVLGDDYVASMLEGKQMGESGFFANSSDAMPALYEKMLKTSVEGPERIKDMPLTHQCVHLCSPQHQSDRKDWIFIIIVV